MIATAIAAAVLAVGTPHATYNAPVAVSHQVVAEVCGALNQTTMNEVADWVITQRYPYVVDREIAKRFVGSIALGACPWVLVS